MYGAMVDVKGRQLHLHGIWCEQQQKSIQYSCISCFFFEVIVDQRLGIFVFFEFILKFNSDTLLLIEDILIDSEKLVVTSWIS